MHNARGLGRAMFAAVLLMVGGVLNIIYGIAAIGHSRFFTQHAHYVFANLRTWGWVTLILGVLELVASLSLFGGGAYGRWFAIVVGCFAAIGALLSIPAYPAWSLAIFAVSVWIIYGLIVFEGPDELAASASSATSTPSETTSMAPPRVPS
jgi:hypothetical protein